MPYFRGQALGDDQLQATLAQYRQQNPGADLSDQNVLNVLEGRAQPTWAMGGGQGGGPQMPQQAPGGMLDATGRPMQGGGPFLPPGAQTGATFGGNLMGGAYGMAPLSSVGRGALGGLFGGIFGGGRKPQPPPYGQPTGGLLYGGQFQSPPGTPGLPFGGGPSGGLDPYGRVPFDPTYGAPPPPGGFPGWSQLHGQAGQMTPLSQMGYPGVRY